MTYAVSHQGSSCSYTEAAADNKGVLRYSGPQRLQIPKYLRTLLGKGRVPGQDQISPPLQRAAAGKGGQRFAAQDHRMAGGQRLEPLQVLGQIHQLVPVLSDAPIFVHCYDHIHGVLSSLRLPHGRKFLIPNS